MLDALNSISKDATIGFENDHKEPPGLLLDGTNGGSNNTERENIVDEKTKEVLQLPDASNAELMEP